MWFLKIAWILDTVAIMFSLLLQQMFFLNLPGNNENTLENLNISEP